MKSSRSDRGAVTAETALVLPVLMAVTIVFVWLLALGAAQIRAVDAARETARALARGDDQAAAVAVGTRIAPAGSSVRVVRTGAEITVTVSGPMPGPEGILGHLPVAKVRADAVTTAEDQ